MCIHHIDIDPTNNSPDNLAVLCSPCHLLLHKVLLHPNAGAIVAWMAMHYPEFSESWHDSV